MLKTIILAGTMTMAAPVLAQATPQAAPVQQAAPQTLADPAASAPQTAPDAATAPAEVAPTQTAAAAPAEGTQVAQAVDTQFGQYDKNADGKLSRVEFSEWMVALKTASDPATKAESAETKKWVGAAFAQADTDKSKSLDKTEVTGFLTKGQS